MQTSALLGRNFLGANTTNDCQTNTMNRKHNFTFSKNDGFCQLSEPKLSEPTLSGGFNRQLLCHAQPCTLN